MSDFSRAPVGGAGLVPLTADRRRLFGGLARCFEAGRLFRAGFLTATLATPTTDVAAATGATVPRETLGVKNLYTARNLHYGCRTCA